MLGDADGIVRARAAWPTQAHDGDALLAAIVAAVRQIAPQAERIGVAVGGPMNARTGAIGAPPHLPGLHGVALRTRLETALQLPVTTHHDAAACALAEWHWGADRGAGGIAYLTSGTGFGCGLVLDGRVRYGSTGISPELGHVRYRETGPDVFGKPGCFESYGAASALPKIARIRDASFAARDGAEVAERAAAGDALAQAAIDDNADAVGAACAMLADLLALDVIVLGSLAVYLGSPWIARVNSTFAREALADHAVACRLRAASLDDVQDRSGLAAAISEAGSHTRA